ncbi:Thiamin pyrophosphokinase [Lachnospiraceae bacterium TWA4]|nr:Thiamin pyrophosphokinase [Lachnospiraceae bacterium TWA4]
MEKISFKKDETDTELALDYAIKKGATKVTILGAFGTRMDHVLANIYLLEIACNKGVSCQLVNSKNRIELLSSSRTFKKSESFGKYISFFPWNGDVAHLTLKGFVYELDDLFLEKSCIRGISNEFEKEEAMVSFEEGKLLCIESVD